MTWKRPYEKDAGQWVAYREYQREGRLVRSYIWNVPSDGTAVWSWTSSAADSVRFDSKAEALATVRRGRAKVRGVVTGAHRVEEAQ